MFQPSAHEGMRDKLERRQQHQKRLYDQGAKPLASLQPNDVRYQAGKVWKPAVIISEHSSPRSYNIQTSEGTILRRNRHHLRRTKETLVPCADYDDYYDDELDIDITSGTQQPNEPLQQTELSQPCERRSRYGRVIRPPLRYRN